MNLIKKLSKALATASLATAMVVAPLTACNNTNQNITNNPNNPSQNLPNDPNYSKYSKTLQTVLTDPYYVNLLNEISSRENFLNYKKYFYHVGHPYRFLAEQGYDVDAIKNGRQNCETEIYLMGGEFYFETLVENSGATPYYDCYRLKCKISEKEIEDLNMLFNKKYNEAPLFIQELERTNKVDVLSYTKHAVETYNKLTESFRNSPTYSKNIIGESNVSILLIDYYAPEKFGPRYLSYIIHKQVGSSSYFKSKSKLTELKMVAYGGPYDTDIESTFDCTADFSLINDFTPEIKEATFYVTNITNIYGSLLDALTLSK